MIESDRPAEGQPAETPVDAQPVSIAKARVGRFTLVQRVLREAGIGIALLLMILIFSSFARHFTDESNITNILTQVTINLIMATGMTFVILIGGIDLSVGSVLAFAAMVAGVVLKSEALPGPEGRFARRANEHRGRHGVRLPERFYRQLLGCSFLHCNARHVECCAGSSARGDERPDTF